MDAQVDQLLGRTTDDAGANRAVQVRRQQRAERNRLQNEIAADQEVIGKLNEEAAPIRAQIRKVEAEVGPIKYIAALIYGDQVQDDTTTLEKAVRWVIILIVFVFDPLALSLVIAAQHSYRWLDDDLRNRKKEKDDEEDKLLDEAPDDMPHETAYDVPKEDENVSEPIQSDPIQPDVVVREDVPETPTPDAVASGDSVEQSEAGESSSGEEPVTPVKPAVVKTEGVTLQESDGGYVSFEGKSVSKSALQGMRPDLFLQVDSANQSNTNFGTDFPRFAKKGDTFVRVDTLPNRVFKFSGDKWIEINKNTASSYVYDEEYIAYLVSKIDSGEYDVDLLSDAEKEQIEEYLMNRKN
jgi:hypothetical protein